jgi:hypothetical protein
VTVGRLAVSMDVRPLMGDASPSMSLNRRGTIN